MVCVITLLFTVMKSVTLPLKPQDVCGKGQPRDQSAFPRPLRAAGPSNARKKGRVCSSLRGGTTATRRNWDNSGDAVVTGVTREYTTSFPPRPSGCATRRLCGKKTRMGWTAWLSLFTAHPGKPGICGYTHRPTAASVIRMTFTPGNSVQESYGGRNRDLNLSEGWEPYSKINKFC